MTIVIAEAGVNHNGREDLAFALVDAADKAGANIVKFQTFKASLLASNKAQKAAYQVANQTTEESQLSMLRRLELPFEAHHDLVSHCNSLGIEFLSTAFDLESLMFLANDLGLTRLKIPSGELTNAPLVLEHARTGSDLILSTGMATLSEIEAALGVIAFGYLTNGREKPSVAGFEEAYTSDSGQKILKEKVTILHCTTEYPAPMDSINLCAMDTLARAFDLPAGYSDHTEGIVIPIAAVARGAVMIEKHFTLDKGMEGPDHRASLEPQELEAMVSGIRQIDVALGSSVKRPSVVEVKNRTAARKSLVAAVDIEEGQILSEHNLTMKRPGFGISPYKYWKLLGKKTDRSYKAGDLIIE